MANLWTEQSIDFANQQNYLDELYKIYPTSPNAIREIDEEKWEIVAQNFKKRDNFKLINSLLDLELFPIKDSYVAYLKRDRSALERNPNTINRLASQLYEMDICKLYESCSAPKETNRQIGPMFKRWLNEGTLGFPVLYLDDFAHSSSDAILNASDREAMDWARECLDYQRDKGLDFVARINHKYVIGEAKFLTDYGGHQDNQFEDAMTTLNTSTTKDVIKIAILDGVLYIKPKNKGTNKMYKRITSTDQNILSALLLRNFLYTL